MFAELVEQEDPDLLDWFMLNRRVQNYVILFIN